MTRYADAWHHHEPVWYYLVHVIPLLWLPLIALVPWLWPRWREALREKSTLVAVLLAWVVIVVLFFTVSTGKRASTSCRRCRHSRWRRRRGCRSCCARAGRGAWPSFSPARLPRWRLSRPWSSRSLPDRARGTLPRRTGSSPCCRSPRSRRASRSALAALRVRDGWLAYAGVLGVVLGFTGIVVYPGIDAVRSGRAFTRRVEQASAGIRELGLVSAKEQYLLQLRRPSVNFGHARWRERASEANDAAAWLGRGSARVVS